jgi:hypothetical protein
MPNDMAKEQDPQKKLTLEIPPVINIEEKGWVFLGGLRQ